LCAEGKSGGERGAVPGLAAHQQDGALRAYWRLVNRHYRWNLSVNVSQGALALFSMAVFMPETVLATYMTTLTKSKFLIGLPWALSLLYWAVSAIFYSYWLQGQRQRLRANMILQAPVRVSFTLMALSALFAIKLGPVWALVVFFVGEGLLSLTGGGATLAWQDMLGRVWPPSRRAFSFGLREAGGQLAGLLGATALGLYLAGRGAAAGDYLWPFLAGAFVYWLSWADFFLIREPRWPLPVPERGSWHEYYSGMFAVLKEDRNFRTYVLVKCLMAGTCIFNFGLFASYAVTEFGVSKAIVAGLFTALALAARVIAAPLAGHAADRKGFKKTLLAGLMIGLGTLIVGLLLPFMGRYAVVGFALIYPLNGVAGTTIWIADCNLVLEFGRIEDRARYIAVATAIASPVAFTAGALSGLFVDLVGYRPVMVASLAMSVVVCIVVARVFKDPRHEARPPADA
jgi:MFS family permease